MLEKGKCPEHGQSKQYEFNSKLQQNDRNEFVHFNRTTNQIFPLLPLSLNLLSVLMPIPI